MSEDRGILGGLGGMFGGNSTILFFIIIFLILFWSGRDSKCNIGC